MAKEMCRKLPLVGALLMLTAAKHAPMGTVPDLEKPLYSVDGAPFCKTVDGFYDVLKHIIAGKIKLAQHSFGCIFVKDGLPVGIIDTSEGDKEMVKITILRSDDQVDDYWTTTTALRN